MEHVDGLNLEALVREQGPQSGARAAHFIAQAAAGLSHAHSRSMIHRDVKPSNLLLDPTNTVKVLDLGLARITDDDASLTQQFSDQTLGTTDYIAPEQALDCHGADLRADLYGLGCTLYFLLTGHPPFDEGTVAARLLAHQNQAASPINDERAKVGQAPVDAGLVAICDKMMAKSPDERPQSAREVFEAIAGWLRNQRATGQAGQSQVAAVGAVAAETPPPSTTVAVGPPPPSTPVTPTPVVASDTVATQSGTPTTVDHPGIALSDIFSQSSIYSSSMIQSEGGSSGSRSRSGGRKKPVKRATSKQYLWACIAAGGVLGILISVLVLSVMFSDSKPSGSDAAGTGEAAPQVERTGRRTGGDFDF